MSDVLKVNCPICNKSVEQGGAEFPFCSSRCRTTDLGNWASGKYVISSPMDPLENRDSVVSEYHDED